MLELEALLEAETITSGRHALTIDPLLDALAVAEKRNVRELVACIARRLAWACDFAGDDAAAIGMAEYARAEYEALADLEGMLRSLNNLGVLWTRRGDLEEAKRIFSEAAKLVDQLKIPFEQVRLKINMGYVYLLGGEPAAARKCLEQSLETATAMKHPAQGGAWLNIARIDLAEGNSSDAAAALQRAQPFIQTGNHYGEIETWLLRGQIASQQSRHADAIGCIATGIKMAEAVNAAREQHELWEAMSAAQANSGDFKAALDSLKRANAVDASLRRERAVIQAATLAERRSELAKTR